jgi:hypothetical protein
MKLVELLGRKQENLKDKINGLETVGKNKFIICSLHDVHEMNAYRAGYGCLSA